MGTPIARLSDKVTHPLPGVLQPGPGSNNVIIGFLPAWRGVPALAAAALSAAKAVSDATVDAAKAASTAAMGTPAAPAAKAAEEAVKAAALAAMTSMMNAAKAASTTMAGGSPDIHICSTFPPTPAHGPGMVLDGNPTVLINGLPACQVGDKVTEALGPPDPIVLGKTNVIIGENGGGVGGGLGAALASLLGAAAGAAAAALSITAGVVAFVTEVGKAVVAAVVNLASSVLNAVKEGVATFVDWVKQVVNAVVDTVQDIAPGLFPRVKGMTVDAADKAITKAQKDAVAALDKRIKDLDSWGADTQKSFKKWFGDSDPATRTKMRARMVKARDKINGFTLDNYESDDDSYAYVYGSKDDKMYLGSGFANAPETGRDSKAGTLIHEASHYHSVGHTDDVKHDGRTAYGEAGAEKVAKDDPTKAQKNADNFEYFVEDGM